MSSEVEHKMEEFTQDGKPEAVHEQLQEQEQEQPASFGSPTPAAPAESDASTISDLTKQQVRLGPAIRLACITGFHLLATVPVCLAAWMGGQHGRTRDEGVLELDSYV
eukprot:374035-Pelagomonas_calceolata.AAC.3